MKDYEPIDIASVRNAGAELFGGGDFPAGDQTFQGLPFSIGGAGAGPESCLLAAGPGTRGRTGFHTRGQLGALRRIRPPPGGIADFRGRSGRRGGRLLRLPPRRRRVPRRPPAGALRDLHGAAGRGLPVPRLPRPGGPAAAALGGQLERRRPAPDRGGAGGAPLVRALVVAEPLPGEGAAFDRGGPRAAGPRHRGHHPGPRRRGAGLPPGSARRRRHPAAARRRGEAVRSRGRGRPRGGDLPVPAAGEAGRPVRRRRPQGMGGAPEREEQPGAGRDRRLAVGDGDREAGGGDPGRGQLGGSAGRGRGGVGLEGPGRGRRRRPQLGAHPGDRRRHRQAGPLPHPLPLAAGGGVRPPRAPRPRKLQQRHLALRRRRRPAPRPGLLRLHRRHLPGLAAARRG